MICYKTKSQLKVTCPMLPRNLRYTKRYKYQLNFSSDREEPTLESDKQHTGE